MRVSLLHLAWPASAILHELPPVGLWFYSLRFYMQPAPVRQNVAARRDAKCAELIRVRSLRKYLTAGYPHHTRPEAHFYI